MKNYWMIFLIVGFALFIGISRSYENKEIEARPAVQALKSLQTNIEFQERFLGAADPGFDALLAVIDRHDKMTPEFKKKIRGITSTNGFVYLDLGEGGYRQVTGLAGLTNWCRERN